MKSPRIIRHSWLSLALTLLSLPEICGRDAVVMWTQKSSIWSSIKGAQGDVVQWIARTWDGQSPYRYIRGESQEYSTLLGIGYDHVTDDVCWSDATHHGIYCQPLNDTAVRLTTNIRTILIDKDLDIQDIEVDWQTGNIYFAAGKSIATAPSRNGIRDVYMHLLSKGFRAVSGVALDPAENSLFWTDGGTGEVGSATLAGKKRKQIYNTGGTPLGITVVPGEKRVYWVDNKFGNLESADYDGKNWLRHIEDNHGKDFTGLSIHSSYAVITGSAVLQLHFYERSTSSYTFKSSRELDANPYYMTSREVFPGRPQHDCDTKGCKHICLNLGNGIGTCKCKTGYFLSTDGVSCTERNPRYVYTTGNEVMFATATVNYDNNGRVTLDQKEIIGHRDDVRALGYHYGRNSLYFSDTAADIIFRCDPDDVGDIDEHTVNTRKVEGIAIDWMVSNVYWADKDLGHIMVSKMDGRYHKILVTNAGEPTGIAVDAVYRKLFWNDALEGQEKIVTSQLDGSGHVTIVDYSFGMLHPQGLFVDPHNQRLYWVDKEAGVIECVDYEGKNRIKVMMRTHDQEIYYDVTFYQDLTTWTDVNGGLKFRNTLTEEELQVEDGASQRTMRRAYDVIAYDPYLQPQSENPCERNNGDCQQHCFPRPDGSTSCGCAIGYTLNDDTKTCDTVIRDDHFIFYTDPYHKQIYQSNFSNNQANGFNLPLMDYPISADYDSGKGRVFWIDLLRNEFKRSSANGAEEKVLRTIPVGSRPLRLSVDPVHGWLYYTDRLRGTLSRMKIDGSDHTDIITGLQKPFAVAVNYVNETIAWTSAGKVEVARVDGSDRRVVADDLRMPSGVTFLQGGNLTKHDNLYICDNDTGSVYAYNLTTNIRTELYRNDSHRIYTVAVSDTHLFFTAFNEKSIYRLDRVTGQGVTQVSEAVEPVFARLTDLKVIQGKVIPDYDEGGFNWVILVGALAGILLLLLVLLGAFLGMRKRKQKNAASAANPENGGMEDVNREYSYLDHETLFDIRASHDAMNGNHNGHANGNHNGHANGNHNGHVNDDNQNGYANVEVNGNGNVDDSSTGFDPINQSSETIYSGPPTVVAAGVTGLGAGAVDNHDESNGKVNGTNGMNGTNGVPVGGVAAVGVSTEAVGPAVIAAGRKPRYKANTKRNILRKKKTLPKDPEFEFSPENKVATRIQRLANRLRNRLSSVRWSQSDKADEGAPAPDPAQAPTLQAIGPERTGPDPKGRHVHIPPALHKMPRGFAPASHCVPRTVRTSLGAAKGKVVAQNRKDTPAEAPDSGIDNADASDAV